MRVTTLFRGACLMGLLLILLTACGTPTPAPSTPLPTALPPNVTPNTPIATSVPSTATPAPSPTPVPIELTVCQTQEPTSLYLYDTDTSARAGILDAIYDGPIDSVGYAYQPIILESLPSFAEGGGASLNPVTVNPGDWVVDAATSLGALVPLTAGVTLAQPDGTRLVYTGTEPAQTVQMTALFRLKPGLLWADGQPLTAADSLFSFQIASDPKTPVTKFAVERTARYELVDDLTVRWTGLPGWFDPQMALRFWSPLPRHRFGAFTAEQLLTHLEAVEQPMGWGPFVVTEWAKGDHLTLIRNPNYFRAAEGLPYVDRVVFRFGLDPAQIVSEMLEGRCHIGSANADFRGLVSVLLEAQTNNVLHPSITSSTSFEHLDFGILPAEDYERTLGNDLFQDVRMRQAVAYCLDRPALVEALLYGVAEVPNTYVPNAHPMYAGEGVATYPFDPARGQALLEELGWRDSDGDGARDNGRRKLSLAYVSGPPGSEFREALAAAIQTQLLTHCGVELRPTFLPIEELYAVWPTGPLFGRQFDLGAFPWRASIEPNCELYITEAIPGDQNPGGANNAGYSNPAFDAACHAATTALNEATRRAQHAQAQIIFSQDLPSLPLFLQLKVGVARPEISGYAVDPTANSDLWNVEGIRVNK